MAKSKDNEKKVRGIFERQAGSGVWWILYYDQNGTRHREKIGPKSLAVEVYRKRKTQIKEETFFPERVAKKKRQALLSDAIEDYLTLNSHKRNHDHHLRYARNWREHFKVKALDQIKPADVDRYQQLRSQEVSPASVNREVAFLKAVYNLAIRHERTETNPVARVKMFQENNARIRYLLDEEEDRLRVAMTAEDFLLVEFALETGLRRSEQFHGEWANVDLANGVLTVPQSKHGEKRYVPLSDRAMEILRMLPSRLKSPWIFASQKGTTALDAHNFYSRVFVPALKKAGIEDFHWHDCRHSFASRLVMDGVDLYTVQKLMGHKTQAMTQRYAHLAPDHLRAAVNRLRSRRTSNLEATATRTATAAS